MKVLFLTSQNIFGRLNNGGSLCSKRNYDLIHDVIGEKRIWCGIVWNAEDKKDKICYFRRNKNKLDEILSTISLSRLYRIGEGRKILSYICEVSPDIIFWDTPLWGKLINHVNKNIKNIVFMQNIEADYAKNRLKHGGIQYWPVYIATVYNEKFAFKYAQKIVVLTERDKKRAYELYNRAIDYVLPIGLCDSFDSAKLHRGNENKTIIFVGSNFPPNYDGILWFIENVMSRLQDFKLIIIGKDFELCKSHLERKNVTVVGTTADIGDYYYRYSNIIMPIRYGDGMKVKTAEALMYGMNIFATDEALEGYSISGVKGIHRCNTADEFVDALKKYYCEYPSGEWNRDGRLCFCQNYKIEVQKKIMEKILFD